MTNRKCRVHDQRIKEQILRSRNPNLFSELRIPPSTERSRIQRGLGEVVSLDEHSEVEPLLREWIAMLESRVRMLSAVLRLTTVLLRVWRFCLDLAGPYQYWSSPMDSARQYFAIEVSYPRSARECPRARAWEW